MNVTISGLAEEYICGLVANGSYRDADEAVNGACLMMKQTLDGLVFPAGLDGKLDEAMRGRFHSDCEAVVARVRATLKVEA